MAGGVDLDLHLEVLHRKIRESGWLPHEVEDRLGWERGVVSFLPDQPETLRFDHLLAILEVVGVDPAEYFQEVGKAAEGPVEPLSRNELIERMRVL